MPNISWTNCSAWILYGNAKWFIDHLQKILEDEQGQYKAHLDSTNKRDQRTFPAVQNILNKMMENMKDHHSNYCAESLLLEDKPVPKWFGQTKVLPAALGYFQMTAGVGMGINDSWFSMWPLPTPESGPSKKSYTLKWFKSDEHFTDTIKL